MEALGLGTLGFWLFLAAIIVGGMWFDSKKKESQQETLRRVVESGKHIDAAVIDRMIAATSEPEKSEQDLKVGGIICAAVAPGLAIFGWFLSQLAEELLAIMLGVSLLVLAVGAGLYIAGIMTEHWQKQDL